MPVKLFRVCDLTLSTEAVRQLQSFYQTTAPHITCHSCHYVQTKHMVTKVKVQSDNISASHFSSQPVMMTDWRVSGIDYAERRRKAHGVSAPKTIVVVDFTNATVVGPIRKSNRSNCHRMVWAGQRQPSHQPTDHRPITVKHFHDA